jgi:hypothetical protein
VSDEKEQPLAPDPVLGVIEGLGEGRDIMEEQNGWVLDEDAFLLMAMLADPVYGTELCWEDTSNHEYEGCYRVRDYQYPLFRMRPGYGGASCARKTGKTESIGARGFTHPFRRLRENLLITAPELIHLLPLADGIEDRVRNCRLTREFLDLRGGKTGFTHRPFGVNFKDGTKVVGRIPKQTGTGVKGQHQPDLMIDEAQDYPEAGWAEVHSTVNTDKRDAYGNPDFNYHFYGVHSGARDSGFFERVEGGAFYVVTVTALMRADWDRAQKDASKSAFGSTDSPDYRRNVLGEAGSPATAFFVRARLVACMDQKRDSRYNEIEYVAQQFRYEDVQQGGVPAEDLLDLPFDFGPMHGGMDLGLTDSPTMISMFTRVKHERIERLKLLRRYQLDRLRTKQIRMILYRLANHFGTSLETFGLDITGLGFPIWQEIEDDENVPRHLLDVSRGYFFNAKVPVSVDRSFVNQDPAGNLKDQFGNMVRLEEDPLTGIKRYVTYMPFIEASTRYIREDVDSGYLLLPFDRFVMRDMYGETDQRIRRVGQHKGRSKPQNAFHILDSFRAMEMARKSSKIEKALSQEPEDVFDFTMDLSMEGEAVMGEPAWS